MKKILVLLMMVIGIQVNAQNISGIVTDEKNEPVAFASVALLQANDSNFVAGVTTDVNGRFEMDAEPDGKLLKVSYVGYATQILQPAQNMSIVLKEEGVMIGDVVITGNRPAYKMKGGSLIVPIENTVLSRFGSATEMLSHLPMIMGDGTVVGRGKPEIYINSKKVTDDSELKRLRANEIMSVEIITNPGAEYGTDVQSVIRIKTIRKRGEGWSGNFSALYSQGEQWYCDLNAAFNYRTRNGMDFFAKGYLTESNYLMEYPAQIELITSSTWNYDNHMKWHSRQTYYVADFGWNWEINEHHSLGLTYTANNMFGSNKSKIEQDERVWQDGILVNDGHTTTIEKDKPRMNHSVNAYYIGEIGKWKFDFSADYYRGQAYSEMEGFTNGQPNAASNTTTKNQLLAEKLTITAPVPQGNLTFGEEVSNVDRTNDFLQSGFSSDNHIHQQTTIWSLYANYSLQIKKFSFNAGFRWQNEHNNYDQNGKRQDEMSPDYHVLIPNVSINYRDNKWNHSLSYKCYRTNPPYEYLSSSITYAGKFEYRTGNPFLQPQSQDIISWESQWKWLHVELRYNYTQNKYCDFRTAYDDVNHPGVMLMDFRTIPSVKTYGLYLNASPKIGIWQMNYTAAFYKSDWDLESLGGTHNYNGLCTNFNLDNTFTLPHAWLLNVQGIISPSSKSGYDVIKTNGRLDLRLSKQFLKDKSLSVALIAKDILHTMNAKVTEYNGIGYKVEFNVYRDQRRVGIDISWKFNATSSRYKGTHAGQSERDRL